MSLSEKIKENILRTSSYIDKVQLIDEKPLFSHLDINITELCNRKCVFCPRVDESEYPNQNLNMNLDLAQKISDELLELKYQGVIVLSGFGEPTLHPDFLNVIRILSKCSRLELITNGDKLNKEYIKKLKEAGLNYIVVSMYDGPHQIEPFKEMFRELNLGEDFFLLRDRWHNSDDDYGLKLTNRAGKVTIGNQDEVDVTHPCYYTAYSLTIDWNGDVLLCIQDWNKKVKLGNILFQNLYEVWNSSILKKRRKKLISGNRCDAPCKNCNVDGTLHGFNHIKFF
ncbi:radical SAM protein [Alphaproteobacteria bacterium]|nr:radical SAM protein [Alphaproteobacteria bacterium]